MSWESEQFDAIRHHIRSMEQKLDANMEKIMSALDDLKAALADMSTQIADNNAEIETLLGKIVNPGTSDADVEAAVTQVRALIKANADEVAKARAAAP